VSGDTSQKGSARLANERNFLKDSIEDLERELSSGDVDAADFEILRARYVGRLAEVETALAEAESAGSKAVGSSHAEGDGGGGEAGSGGAGGPGGGAGGPGGGRPGSGARSTGASLSPARRFRRRLGKRRTRLAVGITAASCFVVAAALLAASVAGVRLPGESATGSLSLSSAQQEQQTLDQAALVGSEGQVAEAVQLYDRVLRTDPNQPDALAYGGWLVRLAGLAAKNRTVVGRGDASVAKAVKVAPGYPDAHALEGVILYEDFRDSKEAAAQFGAALRVGASEDLVKSVAAVAAKAFATAREPLPQRYAAAVGRNP
jgi:tetratricopeptide (TPR) repeat protein